MRFWLLILLFPLVLAGCSNDDDVIKPSPMPVFKSQLQVKKLWGTAVGVGVNQEYMALTPAVTERWVFAASRDGHVAKIDRNTGKRVWTIDTSYTITGGVSAGYGLVAFGTANGDAVVLDEKDGKVLWAKEVGGEVLSAPGIAPDLVIVQSIDGRIHALKRKDGSISWLYDTAIPILTLRGESTPFVQGGVTLAGFANGKLAAMDTETGAVAWERPIGESTGRSELERLIDLDGRFWVSGKTVFAATYQGKVAAVDIPSGRLLWQRKMSSFAGVSEFLNQVYVVDAESNVHALDSLSGTDLWTQGALRGRSLSAPTAYDKYVLVGDFQGYLYWLSYQDGSFLARVKVGVPLFRFPDAKLGTPSHFPPPDVGIRAEPVVFDDIVYVQGNGGEVAAYQVIEPK